MSNDIQKELFRFFLNKEGSTVDELLSKLNISKDNLIAVMFSFLQDFLGSGKYIEKKPTKLNKSELKMGKKVEMEHTKNPLIAFRIAIDHLSEIPDYYSRLKKMESGINESMLKEFSQDAYINYQIDVGRKVANLMNMDVEDMFMNTEFGKYFSDEIRKRKSFPNKKQTAQKLFTMLKK